MIYTYLFYSNIRYAMSVIWELDKNFEVVDVWYGKTIIRSSYKLFYEVHNLDKSERESSLKFKVPIIVLISVCYIHYDVSCLYSQMAQAMHDGISLTEIVKNVPELQNMLEEETEKR